MALLPIQNMLLGMRIDPRLLLGANEADVSLPGDIGVLGGQAPGVYQTPPLWGMGYPDYGLTEGGEFGTTAYPQVMPGEDGGAGAGARGGGMAPDYSGEFTPGDIPSQYPRPSFGAASGDGFNPWQLALLAAGSELLKGSGWSRYPVATGQALGSAGQAGLGTYMQAKREQDRSALAREQIEATRASREAQVNARNAQTTIIEERQRLINYYNKALTSGDTKAAEIALRRLIMLSKPETLLQQQKEQVHPFTKETGLDPVKDAAAYADWVKKKTQFAPPMSFMVQPEDAYRKTLAGETAKNISAYQERAQSAMTGAADFQAIADLLGDYEGGAFDEWRAALGKYVPTDELKNMTSANQLAESIRLRASNAFRMPGSVSNYEAQTYINAVPGMIWYKEGRQLAATYARKLADRMAVLSDFMQQEADQSGRVSQVKLNEFDKSLGPIFTPEEKASIKNFTRRKSPSQSKPASQESGPWNRYK